MPAFYLRQHSSGHGNTYCSGRHLVAAVYSLADPKRMKVRVGIEKSEQKYLKRINLIFCVSR